MLYRQIIDCEMDRFSDHAMGVFTFISSFCRNSLCEFIKFNF